MPPPYMLLVSPSSKVTAAMGAALAGHFPVLTAATAQDALRLVSRYGPCVAVFCEMSDHPLAGLRLAARLAQASPGIAVTALVRPPCPAVIRRALAQGRLAGICSFPLSPAVLRQKARRAIDRAQGCQPGSAKSPSHVLTKEEIAFLLRPNPPETRRGSAY